MKTLILLAAVVSMSALVCKARVVRFVVTQQRDFSSGLTFGKAGSYERLDGTAYFEVDPKDPLNAAIVDLDKAPRNSRGMVEFSAPFLILKPVDLVRGNHKIWYGVNNRGGVNQLGYRGFPAPLYPPTNDPLTAADVGNNILLELGYSFVDAGWQGDVVSRNKELIPKLPVATQPNGSPIVARVRIEYSDRTIPPGGTFTLPLEGSPAFQAYEAADTATAHSTLTSRERVGGQKIRIPPDRWAFGRCPNGPASLVPTTTDICLFDKFRADKLYELIYPAKNPRVMGLGYAITRDVGSYLRYQTHDDFGNPNPLAATPASVGVRRAYVSGSSSTGMYLRDWLYLGFNEDEKHRKVFDAAHLSVPGTNRLFANVEFSDPNTYSRQDDRHDFLSSSYPPFTYAVTTDPVSGRRDGILKRPATDPLVFQVDTANEFWNMRASLNVADGAGNSVPIPANVRLYFLSSYAHLGAVGLFTPADGTRSTSANCQYAVPSRNLLLAVEAPTMRALVVALDEWADHGVEPPKSNYPRLDDGTLVPREDAEREFPRIPGVIFPTFMNELELLGFGADMHPWGGVLRLLPPMLGARYKLFVPKPNREDGLDIAGIHSMEIRVPLGTNVGWNLRATGFRDPGLCGLVGSYFPFARTKAERLADGDPRLSLEERYKDHDGFVRAVSDAAQQLVRERFLLPEDANTWSTAAAHSEVLK